MCDIADRGNIDCNAVSAHLCLKRRAPNTRLQSSPTDSPDNRLSIEAQHDKRAAVSESVHQESAHVVTAQMASPEAAGAHLDELEKYIRTLCDGAT